MPQVRPEHLQQLYTLSQQDYPHILHDADYLQGLIFAVCAAPEIPLPEVWLNWAFAQHGQLASEADANRIAEVLMLQLQQQLKAMRSEQLSFPMQHAAVSADLPANSPVSRYLQGLLAGHSQLESVWQVSWERMQQQQSAQTTRCQRDLKHCLMMFSTFADVPAAVAHAKHKGNPQLAAKLPDIYPSLDKALAKYVWLSGHLASFLPEQFETFTQPAD